MTLSVLICDDIASVQSMIRRMLEREGMVAGTAGTTSEMLASYRAERPDVVLLDYLMPGANGLSHLRDLLVLDPDAIVIMCSGTGDPMVRAEALAIGAAAWVLKPIYPLMLVDQLRTLVNARRRGISGRQSA